MTRDEAIDILMSANVWNDEERTAWEVLIPELAESEDERIRKAIVGLIEELQRSDKKFAGVELTDMLAYLEKQKEQKPKAKAKSPLSPHELYDAKIEGISQGRQDVLDHPEQFGLQKPAEWSEEDEKKLERVDDLLWMLDDYISDDCSICEERTARLRDEIHNELFPWLEFLRPQYHGDVTMTEAYKMGLEAGKASSLKPSEEQTNNVIVELTRIELGDIINGLYYLKEKYYEDCKEHNGTATMGLSDEFKFYFKRFNEVLDLYTRLHELEKEKYGTTTDGYYYE